MANPDHVRWLREEGVEAWNRRRRGENFQPDFRGADLFGAELNGVDLREAKLCGTILNAAKLNGADLEEADLTDAQLGMADLRNANLAFAKLIRTDLRDAKLIGANLLRAQPWEANLYMPTSEDAASFLPYREEVTDPYVMQSAAEKEIAEKEINSVTCLLETCRALGETYGYSYTCDAIQFYFRGESCSSWELRPSLMRNSDIRWMEGEKEGKMLLELMSRQPEAFSSLTSALAQWVLAQHHGLRTRLLDITRNPLAALFYACEKCKTKDDSGNKDGRLHVFAVPTSLIKPFNSDAISIATNFAKLFEGEQALLLGKIGSNRDEYHEAMGRLYHFVHEEKPYFKERIDPRDFFRVFVVEPQQSFERIRAQSGAFLISAFHERFERDEIRKYKAGTPVYGHFMLTVPELRKEHILKELRLLNITSETLFPGLDQAARAITQQYFDHPVENDGARDSRKE